MLYVSPPVTGIQAHGNPAELQQPSGGEDAFTIQRQDRGQGGPEQAESETGVGLEAELGPFKLNYKVFGFVGEVF